MTYTQSDKAIVIEILENGPIRIADLTTISKLDIKSKIPFKVGDILMPHSLRKVKRHQVNLCK